MEGIVICTQVSGKIQPHDLYRSKTSARIIAFDPNKPDGRLKVLTEDYYSACSPEVSWDGKSLVFTAKQKQNDSWQIYEMNLGNYRTRKVTSSHENCIDPAHLPNGHLVFSILSDKDTLKTGKPLFTCSTDGSDLRQITYNPVIYCASSVINDGRILSSENTSATDQQKNMLMVMRPDGTKAELFYQGPEGTMILSRAIETKDGKIVFIESLAGIQEGAGITSISYNRPLHSKVNLTSGIKGDFQSVFPLNSGKLMVSYRATDSDKYALYEYDPDTKVLGKSIYTNGEFNLTEAVMVGKHDRPKKLPSEVDKGVKTGLLLCQDINVLDSKFSVKSPILQKATAIEIMGKDSSLGIFQVENDGSFYLKVSADEPFQIRTLDEKGDVFKTCNWIYLRPNERRGCIGCHEDAEMVPENSLPLAVKKAPAIISVHKSKLNEKAIELE